MLNGNELSLQDRLRKAEEAEREIQKLQAVAAEVPELRAELVKLQRRQARAQAREKYLQEAQKTIKVAVEKQPQVPDLLEMAVMAVHDLFKVLKDIDSHRREAIQLLAIVDRADYEVELETAHEEQSAQGRDTRGLAYVLAARHGDRRVNQLVAELGLDSDYLKDCNLGDALHRDVANFVLDHAMPRRKEVPEAGASKPQQIEVPEQEEQEQSQNGLIPPSIPESQLMPPTL